jgi:hypothetical protein
MVAETAQVNQPKGTDEPESCPRSVRIELDYILLAIEALDYEAMEAIVDCIHYLQLESAIPSRVALWRLRNTNPLRVTYQRGEFTVAQAKALVKIIATLAQRINTGLRLLVTTIQQVREGKIEALGLQQNQEFLNLYLDRFVYLHKCRMKPSPLSDQELKSLGEDLIVQLLFCSGTAGEQRLWYSLTAGELA